MQNKQTKLPDLGDSGNARKKTFFFLLMSSLRQSTHHGQTNKSMTGPWLTQDTLSAVNTQQTILSQNISRCTIPFVEVEGVEDTEWIFSG